MSTPEQRLDKEIMIYCGQHGWMCFHTNVGRVMTADGRMFDTGLPAGWPDLLIIKQGGIVEFCETKIHPRKPTEKQLKMLELLQNYGFKSYVAYSLDEFIEKTLYNEKDR